MTDLDIENVKNSLIDTINNSNHPSFQEPSIEDSNKNKSDEV